VRIKFEGIATINVFAGMGLLVDTPWIPFNFEGMVRYGWILHPFATIHYLKADIFSYCI
jgi:hypothetical protein